jgi:hypothetical protein
MTKRFLVLVSATVCASIVVASTLAAAQAANITGKWVFDVQTDQGSGSPVFTFKQEGEKLTGRYQGTFGEADLTGTVKGNAVSFAFKADAQGTAVEITYKGTIEKDTIKGTLDLGGLATGTFTGKRQ